MKNTIRLRLNGREVALVTDEDGPLLDVLRTTLDLTGAKYGCGEGFCGACTVLVDGRPVRACTTAVKQVAGKDVLTGEGLARGDQLHPLQQAFIEHGALQCGYCTPGMLMSACALLEAQPKPDAGQVRAALAGHLCRCTGYAQIVASVLHAAEAGHGD